jgi:hypothetical protein
MQRTEVYPNRALQAPAGPDVRIRACDHMAIWVVDVASHRVIREDCLACARSHRAVMGTGGDRLVPERRASVVGTASESPPASRWSDRA